MTYPKITSADDNAEPGTDQPSEPPSPPNLGPGGYLPPVAAAAARFIEVRANGEHIGEHSLTAMPFVHGVDGSSIQVSDAAEPDAMWFKLIGGVLTTTPAGDEQQASAKFDMREAVVLAHCIVVLARRRGYDIPDTLAEASALAYEERQRWADPEPEADELGYDTDIVGAFAEAASWAHRWTTERQRTERVAAELFEASAELARIEALHTPYTDEHGRKRCRGCIAGYDPATRQLTHCAWPCPTEQARRGELPS
jgi:hypothetical protein